MQNDPTTARFSSTTAKRTFMMFEIFDHDDITDEVLWNGTSGFLLRGDEHPAVVHAISEIGSEKNPLNPGTGRRVTQPQHERMKPGLSPREKDVLYCMVEGHSYKMIADQLAISFETVRTHVKRIYEKLQVHNNTEAVSKTLKCGLLGRSEKGNPQLHPFERRA